MSTAGSVDALFGNQAVVSAVQGHTFVAGNLEVRFADVKPVNRGFPAMVNEQRYDMAELALVTFLQAYDRGRPVTLLPVTLLGRFQHHTLVTVEGSGILTAADLVGARIGVRSWSQTTGVWVRGFLGDDFDLAADAAEWATYEGAHVADVADPDFVRRAPAGSSLAADLLSGAVQAAVLGNDLPDDPRIRTVLADPAREAARWYGRTGAIPLNHMIAVTDDFAAARPDVVAEWCAVAAGAVPGRPRNGASPWLYPAGFDAITPSLELAGRYAFAQGVTTRLITADEVRTKAESVTGLDLGRVQPAVLV